MRPETWYDAIARCQHSGQSYVLATVLAAAGSTPRECGAKMVITDDSQYDTIGGGHLEFDTISIARKLLAKGKDTQHIESYPLSSRLGQCCGGAVKVLFEVKTCHSQTLAVFGAGHVAKALIPILSQLPLQIRWIDSRPDAFYDIEVADNVICVTDDDPAGEIRYLPENSWLLVLTHDHQLDYDLVETALRSHQFPYVGMIGSDTKARRFRTRLENRGLDVNALVSPVGYLSITGKRPVEVAVSISAQIIENLNRLQEKHKEAGTKEKDNLAL